MDFTKFVSLLDRRESFFSRIDRLNDPFEGKHSKVSVSARSDIYKDGNVPPEEVGELYERLRRFTTVSCWLMPKLTHSQLLEVTKK
jgi:hypothetical protein